MAEAPQKIIDETKRRIAFNEKTAASMNSRMALLMYPAMELKQFYGNETPDSWAPRWQAAGDSIEWEGAAKAFREDGSTLSLIALKTSPIWAALGKGAGGYLDATGSSVPPFAWGSGLGWLEVSIDRAVKCGIVSNRQEWYSRFPPDDGDNEIAEALKRLGPKFTADLLKALK